MARLSKRMEAVAALVTVNGTLADVGTDHAYVPIALVERGRIRRAVAMDIGEGPLSRARANIAAAGLENRITARLSDGLTGLAPGEADSILIAGMGGELTLRILSAGSAVCGRARELILQPQSEIHKVRAFLRSSGYRLEAEDMVCEDGKYYPMMRAVHGEARGGDAESICDYYGPRLMEAGHPVLHIYLERERKKLEQMIARLSEQRESEALNARMTEVREQLERNEQAYTKMGEK